MSDTPPSMHRRQRLRVLAKLLLAIGVFAVIYVFFSTVFSGADRSAVVATQRVDLSQIAPGEALLLLWENRPVIILHRTEAQTAALENLRTGLRDPDSTQSQQPAASRNALRSLSRQWFVALASGTDLGCGLQYLPQTHAVGELVLEGALIDRCRGSVYDLAGRVLAQQAAQRNLSIPEYRLHAGQLLLGASAAGETPGAQ